MKNRKYDVIIFGATGFTGTLVAEYFSQYTSLSKDRWAIAGRNSSKLNQLKSHLVNLNPACHEVGIVVADSHDQTELEKMTAQSDIIVSTVGPYALHGESLVKACIHQGCHYLDITGEPNFVADMIQKYDRLAKKNNVLVVNCCGFDSIPADLGAFYVAQQFTKKEAITIKAFVTSKGQFSGGTWQSALNAMAEGSRKKPSDGSKRIKHRLNRNIHFDKTAKKWAVPMPVIDPWIVKRSAKMLPGQYGTDFQYGHYLGMKNLGMLAGLLTGVGLVFAGSQFKPTRELLKKYRSSGEGPDPQERATHFFRLTFYAHNENERVRAHVQGGDPGYTETSKMLSESALTILKHYDELDCKGGVVTPAGALGNLLIQRLQAAGIVFNCEKA